MSFIAGGVRFLQASLFLAFFVFSVLLSFKSTAQPAPIIGGVFPITSYTLSTAPYLPGGSIALGDLNSDGIQDIIGYNGGWSIGPNSGAFRSLLLNEDSSSFGWSQAGSAAMAPSLNGYRAVASADFNNDGKDDVVSLSFFMDLAVFLNQGHQVSVNGFQNYSSMTNIAASTGWSYSNSLNDRIANVTIFKTGDFDGDGNQDLMIGMNLIHYFIQNFVHPGLLIYWGRGDGTFDPVQVIPTNYPPIDIDFADWNDDGIPDTYLYLGQNVINGINYSAAIEFFRIGGANNRTVSFVAPSQWVGSLHLSGLRFIGSDSILGDKMIALSGHSFPSESDMQPEVYIYALNSNMSWQSGPTPIALPYHPYSGVDGELQGLRFADFNYDGHKDLLALYQREYTSGSPTRPAELLLISGPFDTNGNHGGFGTLTFPGVTTIAINQPLKDYPTGMALFRPNKAYPDILQIADLNSDRGPDIIMGGIGVPVNPSNPNSSLTPAFISLVNYTAWAANSSSVCFRSNGTGTPSNNVISRCGIEGGKPTIGNSDFKINLQNSHSSGVAALWGAYNQNATSFLSLNLAFTPESFSRLYSLSSTEPNGGTARHAVPIPNHPSLVGTTASFQWVTVDTNSNEPFPVFSSDSLSVIVGQ